MSTRARIMVGGLVQGVGFRPFCYWLANRFELKGFVRNMGDAGVEIVVEGDRKPVEQFIEELKHKHPPLARVEEVRVEWGNPTGEFTDFRVEPSAKGGIGANPVIPADLTICQECLREIRDRKDRRYRFPFTTCVNCGPRFTIIEELPYDRVRTSMREFPMCPDCEREYTNPLDRRYRAEPTCCPRCGPSLLLLDREGKPVQAKDLLSETAKLLDEGALVAIKGIGGMHIACKTSEDPPIERLRKAFNRPFQPFALMALTLSKIEEFAEISEADEQLLKSVQRPITVLKKRRDFPLSDLVSPGLHTVGVMLPYSGIHHLILEAGRELAYVMTSANFSGVPMIVENGRALQILGNRVDFFLLHNRRIVNRCDDSVVRVVAERPTFIRRSRGYAPMPYSFKVPSEQTVLALGGDLCVTASFLKNGRVYSTQHVGDVEHLETMDFLKQAVHRLAGLLGITRVDLVVCDLHPRYTTSLEVKSFASDMGGRVLRVQHHKAHLAGLMAEHRLSELVGIAADGAGYGEDGRVWGGEVIRVDGGEFERVGGLISQPMPGGDLATLYPGRMVAGILSKAVAASELKQLLLERCGPGFPRGREEINLVLQQLEKKVNVFWTSSTGRILDSLSCLLGVCHKRTYEGEPAMKLEALASTGDPHRFRVELPVKRENGRSVLDTTALLVKTLEGIERGISRRDLAAGAQRSLAEGLAGLAVEEAVNSGIKNIGVSGGVFYNHAITSVVKKTVENHRLRFFAHREIPPGDGGLSVGQVVYPVIVRQAPA